MPAPKARADGALLANATSHRFDRIEAEIEHFGDRGWYRKMQLRRLHDNAVELFINSPRFGVGRMMLPSARALSSSLTADPVPPQPGPRLASTWSPGNHERPPESDEPFLCWMYEESIKDFVFTPGFGFAQDRRHVAGFVSHRFTQVPAPSSGWKRVTILF